MKWKRKNKILFFSARLFNFYSKKNPLEENNQFDFVNLIVKTKGNSHFKNTLFKKTN